MNEIIFLHVLLNLLLFVVLRNGPALPWKSFYVLLVAHVLNEGMKPNEKDRIFNFLLIKQQSVVYELNLGFPLIKRRLIPLD